MDKTADYLRLLQERNRLKKAQAIKTKDEQIKEELEKGFTTHFRGAHASKDTKTPAPLKVAAVKPLNILGRLAQGANNMWKRNDMPMSPIQPADEANYNEYESDFDDVSDTELDQQYGRRDAKAGVAHSHLSAVEEEEMDDQGLHVSEDKSIPDVTNTLKDVATSGVWLQSSAVSGTGSGAVRNHSAAANATAGVEQVQGHVALDASLQTRVQDLSVEQKLKLLKLLEQDIQ